MAAVASASALGYISQLERRMAMMTLLEMVQRPGVRPQVVEDGARLIDDEVKRKSGLSGLAIKGAYALVKAIKPGIIPESMDHLLDGFLTQLEPYYVRAPEPAALQALLVKEKDGVAEALLHFTDEKARVATNATMRKAYEKLRPSAKQHVEQAVPGLAQLIQKNLASGA